MSSTLHTATVGLYLQLLPPLGRMIDRAEVHCRENGLPASALTDARLAPDMWNFSQQIQWAVLNSAGAIEALRSGLTGPDKHPAPTEFAPLKQMISHAIGLLKAVAPGEVDEAAGRPVRIAFANGGMDFIGEDFLLSFTVPNFLFHATTAYAILRHHGLNLGKTDFLGRIRLNT